MKKLFSIVCLAACILFLNACGSSQNWSRDIVGTWEAENTSVEHTNPLIAQMAARMSVRFVFEENGTFIHEIYDGDQLSSQNTGTYRLENLNSDHPIILMDRPELSTAAEILESNSNRTELRLSVTRSDTGRSDIWHYTKIN